MKIHFIALLLSIASFASANSLSNHFDLGIPAAKPALLVLPSQEKKAQEPAKLSAAEIIDQYMAGWNAHDSKKAADLLDENVVYHDASMPEPQKGRENARKNIIQAFITAAPDLSWKRDMKVEPFAVSADVYTFTWTFSGTNTGDWSDGTKATGKKFSIVGSTVIRIKNGKIAVQYDFYDAKEFYRQLGL